MVDRERILARLDDLDTFLRELRSIAPKSLDEYLKTEKRRACERLVQVAVEALDRAGVLSDATAQTLKRMKGLRNLLVHEYSRVSDQIVFETIRDRLGDFDTCKREILDYLRRR